MNQQPVSLPDDIPEFSGTWPQTDEAPGAFDGAFDAMKGILPSAAYETGSAALGAIGSWAESASRNAAAEAVDQGLIDVDPEMFSRRQGQLVDAKSQELRKSAEKWKPDPTTTGTVGQLIYGIGTELTKAAGAYVTSFGNPAAAALLYGAEHGISTAQKLEDKGVDGETAASAGIGAFAAGTLGFLVPARFGATRLSSAVFGATANPALSIGEEATIKTVLQQGDYQRLAAEHDPFDPLNLAIQAVVGGAFGAMAGGNATPRRAEARPVEAGESQKQAAAALAAKADAADQTAAKASSTAMPASDNRAPVAEASGVERIQEASQLRMAENGVVLQNRNRNTASSIAQMQSIAGNPDYNLVSISSRFESGAPVIAYADALPPEQFGRHEMVSASDGSKMDMRYAVVEAEQLQVSNFADGTRNESYGQVARDVTIAGNGRVAGITEAYRRGTASKYKADLAADADNYGISRVVVEGMNHPVLVRVMRDQDARRPDIAMLSNESGTKGLDATEQAENDATRIDLSQLKFDEEGNITPETVRQFVALVPDPSSIMDRQGVPNSLARPRLERAIFQAAYHNANLTSLTTEADGAARNLVNLLTREAPKMMQLDGTGELDFRDDLIAAVNEIYAAKSAGTFVSLRQLAAERPMGRTPEAQAFLDYFATIGNKTKEPLSVLDHMIDWSVTNNPNDVGMFADEAPVATRADWLAEFSAQTGIPVDAEAIAGLQRSISRQEQVQTIKKTIVERLQNFNRIRENANATLAESREKIQGIVSRVLRSEGSNSQGKDSFADYLPVSQSLAERIKAENNIDVFGYVHSISDSSVSHALNRHGVGKERRADQVPITEEDFSRLPEVVGDPDSVLLSNKKTGRTQLEALTYTKEFPDGVTYVVEEIRKGRKKLMFHTAYKKAPSTPRATSQNEMASRQRPKRIESDLYTTSLRTSASASKLSAEQIEAQANLWSSAVVRMAEQMGVDPLDILPKIDMSGPNPEGFAQTAYHGSPHVFDRFSTDAVGSGEGAQAHGWGLYFSQDRGVAEGYRARLVHDRIDPSELVPFQNEFAQAHSEELARIDAELTSGDPNDLNRRAIEALRGRGDVIAVRDSSQSWPGSYRPDVRRLLNDEVSYVLQRRSGGRVFQVDIPDERLMLDEDLPFYQQPYTVRQAILKLMPEYSRYQNVLPQDAYRSILERSLLVASNSYQFDAALRRAFDYARENYVKLLDNHDRTADEQAVIDALAATMRPDGDYQALFEALYPGSQSDQIERLIRMNTPFDGETQNGMAGLLLNRMAEDFLNRFGVYQNDPVGLRIYRDLSRRLGGDKNASMALRSEGVAGITYNGNMDGRCFVVFNDKAVRVMDYWQTSGGDILGAYNAQQNAIHLTPNADVTTFSHEMGHWWLTNAIEASKRHDVDLGLRRDVRTLLDAFGVKDAADWDARGVEGQRAYHEQFASWVEEYLVTGKPANEAVRGILERFRLWITALYRDFRAHLEGRYRSEFGQELPPLSDEVRGVLDRALAYEDSMAAAQRQFSPTHAQMDAARYANFERQVIADQLADPRDADSLQSSIFAEATAESQLNNGEMVSVSPRIDVEKAEGIRRMVLEGINAEQTLRPRPDAEADVDMPVTAPPPPHPVSTAERAARDANAALQSDPNLIVAAIDVDGQKQITTAAELKAQVDQEAAEIERFADILGDAAGCVWRNGGLN